MDSSREILSLHDLKIGYASGRNETIILHGLNAGAREGELIAVIGKNGIGKSTLLRTLAGLQTSLGGNILYDGRSIREYSRIELARKTAYISTEIVKASNMSVYDLAALGRFPYTSWTGRINSDNHRIVLESIANAGMAVHSSRYIAELSDGERQRAMIARILAQDTGLMIMDEPTAFLDIGSKFEILHLLHDLAKSGKKTIIFSTHDLHIAISQADKIWLLHDNRLAEGAPEDLMIQGDFDHLFDSSPVRYNSEHGTFTFLNDEKGSIYIEGEGILRHWTEKAVNRAGFSVSKIKKIPSIIIPSGNCEKWQLKTQNSAMVFGSVYELISRLNLEVINHA